MNKIETLAQMCPTNPYSAELRGGIEEAQFDGRTHYAVYNNGIHAQFKYAIKRGKAGATGKMVLQIMRNRKVIFFAQTTCRGGGYDFVEEMQQNLGFRLLKLLGEDDTMHTVVTDQSKKVFDRLGEILQIGAPIVVNETL